MTTSIAWRLADELAPGLDAAERIAVFVALGCGDDWSAIDLLMTIAVREDLRLSHEVRAEFTIWLQLHAENPDAAPLRTLLALLPRRRLTHA